MLSHDTIGSSGYLLKRRSLFASSHWDCPARKIRREDMKLPVIRAYQQEAIIVLNRTDNLDTCCRCNGDGVLMVVVEREYRHRMS
jgi:hypothetical protein